MVRNELTRGEVVSLVVRAIRRSLEPRGCCATKVCKLVYERGYDIEAHVIRDALRYAVREKRLAFKGSKFLLPPKTPARRGRPPARKVGRSTRKSSPKKSCRKKLTTKSVARTVKSCRRKTSASQTRKGRGVKKCVLKKSKRPVVKYSTSDLSTEEQCERSPIRQPYFQVITCPNCAYKINTDEIKNREGTCLSQGYVTQVVPHPISCGQQMEGTSRVPHILTDTEKPPVLSGPDCNSSQTVCDGRGVDVEGSGCELGPGHQEHDTPPVPRLVTNMAQQVRDFFLLPFTDPNCSNSEDDESDPMQEDSDEERREDVRPEVD